MKGESYYRAIDELTDLRGAERKAIVTGAAPPPGAWDWYAQCGREGFVNCVFGPTGFCQNPRHAPAPGWGTE